MNIEEQQNYAKRSLLGLALGDCFGQTFFENNDTVLERIKNREIQKRKWFFTDDTVMAIGIYRVLEKYHTIDSDKLAAVFGQNYLMQWHRGYGGTAHSILRAIGEGEDFRNVSAKVFDGMGSMGNGAAMRVAPLGAYFADDLEQVIQQAKLSAEITHTHLEGIAGAIAVAVAAAWMIHSEKTFSSEKFLYEVAEHVPESDTKYKILSAIPLAKESHMDFIVSVLGNGTALTSQDTVPLALWCVAHYSDSYVEALWRAVSALGDRDTICAIVGGIVSLKNFDVPEEWLLYMEKPEESEFFQTEI